MSCTCSDETFTFNLFKQNGIYKVEKCGRLKKETGKKKSCEFYKETLIEERKIIPYKCVEETTCLHNRDYRKELIYYIDMCEKFGINETYAGNIVHLLNICGYRYISQEKLSCLKKRLNYYPDKQEQMKSAFPIVLVELPDNLKIKNQKYKNQKYKNQKYKNTKIKNTKKNFDYIIISEDDTDSENSEKTDDENYTFDVEEFISEEEIEEDFDVGYSSD